MDKFLFDRIEQTIENYREAKVGLRNDGDVINHFASLVFAHYEKDIPVERIKEIRRYIKATTPRMSSFRGDILYIISILLATTTEDYEREIIEEMYLSMNMLEEAGFVSGVHLALTSYTIARYGRGKDKVELINKIKNAYSLLKEKYYTITKEDDYLICALWALNDIEIELVDDFVENVFEHVADSKIRSKNGIQGLANAILLNGSSGHMYRTMEFILSLQKRDIKIANQFLPLVGMLSNYNPRRSADVVEGVIEALCDEESEYEFYMDKGFRTIIAIVIVSFCTISEKRRYIDELLAHGIISFIDSKNKGIFAEALN